MKSSKALIGVLAGVAIAATLGILLTSDKGIKTRKLISKKSGEYASDLKDKFDDLFTMLTDKFDETKKGAEKFTEKTKV